MNNLDILVYLGYIVLTLNVLVYFKSYKEKNVAFKLFFAYLLGSVILQYYSSYLMHFKIHNLFISHYFFIGKFILLSLFFRQILKQKIVKKIISVLLALVLVAITLNIIFFEYVYVSFNLFEIIVTVSPIIMYCILFFMQKIESSNTKYIYIVSGMFLYFLCSLLLFAVGNIEAEIKIIIWYSNASLYLVYQLLIFIEWYKHFRRPIKTHVKTLDFKQ